MERALEMLTTDLPADAQVRTEMRTEGVLEVELAGVTAPGKLAEIDVGQINRTMVLNNQVIFGSVNANRTHYEMAAAALAKADRNWLGRLITRRVPLDRWAEAIEHRPGDIKTIIEIAP